MALNSCKKSISVKLSSAGPIILSNRGDRVLWICAIHFDDFPVLGGAVPEASDLIGWCSLVCIVAAIHKDVADGLVLSSRNLLGDDSVIDGGLGDVDRSVVRTDGELVGLYLLGVDLSGIGISTFRGCQCVTSLILEDGTDFVNLVGLEYFAGGLVHSGGELLDFPGELLRLPSIDICTCIKSESQLVT